MYASRVPHTRTSFVKLDEFHTSLFDEDSIQKIDNENTSLGYLFIDHLETAVRLP